MYDEKCLTRIGGNIRFLRAACQISQQEMAERIGISQTHLSNLEHNHAQISLKLLLRIANVLACQLEVFLDTQAALDWGQEQAEKTVPEQESLTETLLLRRYGSFCSCCGCQNSKRP